MISDVERCVNSYVHGQAGGDPSAKRAECPVCHKMVKILRGGTLYPHGVTRRKLRGEKLPPPYEPKKKTVDQAAYVQKVVDQAPPLSAEQRDRLRALLQTGVDHG